MAEPKYAVFENDVAPVRDGMYQRSFKIGKTNFWCWAKFKKGVWYVGLMNYEAAKNYKDPSGYQVGDKAAISSLQWRGLAKNPNK